MVHRRDPRTKEELLDRMLSFDFDGDIRNLGAEPARLSRTGPNRLELKFPISGRCYELAIKLPRDAQPRDPEPRQFARSGEAPFPEEETAATIRERQRRAPRSRARPANRQHDGGGARN